MRRGRKGPRARMGVDARDALDAGASRMPPTRVPEVRCARLDDVECSEMLFGYVSLEDSVQRRREPHGTNPVSLMQLRDLECLDLLNRYGVDGRQSARCEQFL